MKAIAYQITALAPLIFSSKTGDPNIVSTLDYIPGTQIRGVFANEYIRRRELFGNAESDQKFVDWFINGKLKYLNAYIAKIEDNRVEVFHPIPLSIQKIKNKNEAFDLFSYIDESLETKPIADSYGRFESNLLKIHSVKKSINFHHKRDRQRGVSEEGLIFNYESIDPNQTFLGYIIGDEETLIEFQKEFSIGVYHIGRSRTSQYGKIEFKIISDKPFDFKPNFEDISDKKSTTLVLISDTLIINEYGYSTVNIDDFIKATGLDIEECFIRSSDEEGYISVWRLKTPSERCLRAGSSFKIGLNSKNLDRLRELWESGIGELTDLGFGRFNLIPIIYSKYQIYEFQSLEDLPEKPTSISNATKKLIMEIIEKELMNFVEKDAIKKADNFKNLPSKSLLSKLELAVRREVLHEILTDLRDISRAKLEGCKSDRETLLEFLLNAQKKLDDVLRNLPKLGEICKETSLDFDEQINQKLTKAYLETFLFTLIKLAKIGR